MFLVVIGWTIFRREVKAGAIFTVKEKFAVLTFFAIVMRRKRINFGNTAKMCGK